ncbi:hypothetical protein CRG98_028310 [Punica granatum]|uniref:Gamma-interferon-inducible lysosomal thiol reductase-like n=1 Tax=Punica granatum TaxID=22663 RepID=A0A2I0J4X0_PUNGR|nr:hypothetical protein CRG98_028310 [Punica granatum]
MNLMNAFRISMEANLHFRAAPIFLFFLSVLAVDHSLEAVSASSSRFIIHSPGSGTVKVPVVLYYETLCPYCANFIVNGLSKVFDNGLTSIIDLKLVPYGNAKIGANDTISCQSDHFPLIYCIEKMVHTHEFTQWESCFSELGLDSKPVYDCYTSGRGTKLELQYAAETNALQPPHQYVPWVVVNGKPLYEDYENFESYICEAYSGTSAPKACSELSHDAIKSTISVKKHQVCYKDNSAFISRMREAAASVMRWINVVG